MVTAVVDLSGSHHAPLPLIIGGAIVGFGFLAWAFWIGRGYN